MQKSDKNEVVYEDPNSQQYPSLEHDSSDNDQVHHDQQTHSRYKDTEPGKEYIMGTCNDTTINVEVSTWLGHT